MDTEIEDERIRQRLSSRPLFNASEAFEAIDMNKDGYLTG
jgi:hypothetical protein